MRITGFTAIRSGIVRAALLAALVLPDFTAGEPRDLKAHYYREARPFYLVTVAMLVASFFKEVVIEGRPPESANLAFHCVFGAIGVIAAISRNPRLHEGVAVLTAILLAAYIALLFATLG